MIIQFKIYEESYHERFKKSKVRLQDLPVPELPRRTNLKKYKYKEDDIIYHIALGKVFIIKSVNDCSDNQDYYIINPTDTSERGWVIEEELRNAEENEKDEASAYLAANKYNL